MRAHRIMALLCAGILALSPAGGHLAYASETQEAQETSAAPGTEVTELEEDGEDPAEGVSIPKETEDASTTAVTDDGGSDQEEQPAQPQVLLMKSPEGTKEPEPERPGMKRSRMKNPPRRIPNGLCFPLRRSGQSSCYRTSLCQKSRM